MSYHLSLWIVLTAMLSAMSPERTQAQPPDSPGTKNPHEDDLPRIRPPKLPGPKAKLIQLNWQLKKGDELYQGITVVQNPSYRVQGLGLTIRSQAQYSILSKLTVESVAKDGSRVIQQKIVNARLDKADEMMRGMLAGPLKNIVGKSYRIHLNADMEVKKLEGFEQKLNVQPVKNLLGGQGFMVGTLIDKDGWKELTEATFFVPARPFRKGETWGRAMTHQWGPLGFWRGMALYKYHSNKDNLHTINYTLSLKHFPPMGGGVGMPFRINNASFVPQIAGGSLVFDQAQGRVVAAQERFRVVGKVAVQLAGQNVVMQIDEDQLFRIRIYKNNPLKNPANNQGQR